MISTGRSNICRAIAASVFALLIVSCSGLKSGKSKPAGEISKVKYYLLDPLARNNLADDPSIPFERDYLLRGALSQTDVSARTGHYYTIFWSVADRSQPVKVRFEYRQVRTGFKIHTKEVDITDVKKSNVTKFQVTGDEFLKAPPAEDGQPQKPVDVKNPNRVTCFKVSLVRGKEILAENKSYMWEREKK